MAFRLSSILAYSTATRCFHNINNKSVNNSVFTEVLVSRYADGKLDRSTITFHVIFIFLFIIFFFFFFQVMLYAIRSNITVVSKLFVKLLLNVNFTTLKFLENFYTFTTSITCNNFNSFSRQFLQFWIFFRT